MKFLLASLLAVTMLLTATVHAQNVAAPAPVVSVAPAQAEAAPAPAQTGSGAVAVLEKIDKGIPVGIASGVLMILIFLIELLVRAVPSVKPRSLLIVVSSCFMLLASIFTKLSALLDKVVQNLKGDK